MDDGVNMDRRIGEAWKAHYQGQDGVAIEHFEKLLAEDPDNIDANWGLGLSYRDAGDSAKAIAIFEKVKQLVAARLEVEDSEYERYFMLSRMVSQQLERIGGFVESAPDDMKDES